MRDPGLRCGVGKIMVYPMYRFRPYHVHHVPSCDHTRGCTRQKSPVTCRTAELAPSAQEGCEHGRFWPENARESP